MDILEANSSNICENHTNAIFYPLYQIVYMINALFSITAIFTCSWFLRKYIWRSTFHQNFRYLITLYFLMAILHSVLFIASYIQVLIQMLNFETNCDANLPPLSYAFVHFPLACCISCGMFTQVILVVERVIATINVRTYENSKSLHQCGFYMITCIMVPTTIIIWAYSEADFYYPVSTALSPPQGINSKLNPIYIFGIFLSITSLITLRILKHVNKKQEHNFAFSLSARYQVTENIATTKFITSILANNLTISLAYLSGTYILRNFEFDIFKDQYALLSTVKFIFYLHPLFAFSLPIFSSWHLSKMRKERARKSERVVTMKAKGREASDAYNQLLSDQWSTYFKKS